MIGSGRSPGPSGTLGRPILQIHVGAHIIKAQAEVQFGRDYGICHHLAAVKKPAFSQRGNASLMRETGFRL